ncbi:hypothetical protein AVEN_228354-1 [Araneus ventricosus]|uniref:Uncharacterized protein n=1 Tax=Araneus ventricosus TaxID=182803 RepID=A0A4Y2K6P8_ARAVE|nr:hypothetical protein AVEN_228354-1 [Araneus ventricosus]
MKFEIGDFGYTTKNGRQILVDYPPISECQRDGIVNLPQNSGRWKETFNNDQIKALKDYITEIDRRAFGLTRMQFGRLCFDFTEQKGINHRFNKQKMTAGKDFIAGFMHDYSLSLRAPETTSQVRISALNSVNIEKLFDTLKEMRENINFDQLSFIMLMRWGFHSPNEASQSVITRREPQGDNSEIC